MSGALAARDVAVPIPIPVSESPFFLEMMERSSGHGFYSQISAILIGMLWLFSCLGLHAIPFILSSNPQWNCQLPSTNLSQTICSTEQGRMLLLGIFFVGGFTGILVSTYIHSIGPLQKLKIFSFLTLISAIAITKFDSKLLPISLCTSGIGGFGMSVSSFRYLYSIYDQYTLKDLKRALYFLVPITQMYTLVFFNFATGSYQLILVYGVIIPIACTCIFIQTVLVESPAYLIEHIPNEITLFESLKKISIFNGSEFLEFEEFQMQYNRFRTLISQVQQQQQEQAIIPVVISQQIQEESVRQAEISDNYQNQLPRLEEDSSSMNSARCMDELQSQNQRSDRGVSQQQYPSVYSFKNIFELNSISENCQVSNEEKANESIIINNNNNNNNNISRYEYKRMSLNSQQRQPSGLALLSCSSLEQEVSDDNRQQSSSHQLEQSVEQNADIKSEFDWELLRKIALNGITVIFLRASYFLLFIELDRIGIDLEVNMFAISLGEMAACLSSEFLISFLGDLFPFHLSVASLGVLCSTFIVLTPSSKGSSLENACQLAVISCIRFFTIFSISLIETKLESQIADQESKSTVSIISSVGSIGMILPVTLMITIMDIHIVFVVLGISLLILAFVWEKQYIWRN